MNKKEIYLNIPNEQCEICEAVLDSEKKFDDFSQEMIDFINKTKFIKKNLTCVKCEKEFIYQSIRIEHKEKCENKKCESDVEEHFCSKECAISFIKDKMDDQERRDTLKKL